jgi:DNA repair photolyase
MPRKSASNPQKVSGTKEWAEHNFNCFQGCSHDCVYCYARGMALRFRRVSSAAQWPKEQLRPKMLDKGWRKRRGRIMFPTTHDITPDNLRACESVLVKMLEAGNEILIVSKPHLECIKRLCKTLTPFRGKVMFRFTIGLMDERLRALWEPGAPSFGERLASLRHAYWAGFTTSVSCEPLLEPWNARKLVDRLSPFVTDSIWIGKINNLRRCVGWKLLEDHPDLLRLEEWQTDEKVREVAKGMKGLSLIKWKDSYKKVLGVKRPTKPGQDV